jgi:hypothetical protein
LVGCRRRLFGVGRVRVRLEMSLRRETWKRGGEHCGVEKKGVWMML